MLSLYADADRYNHIVAYKRVITITLMVDNNNHIVAYRKDYIEQRNRLRA